MICLLDQLDQLVIFIYLSLVLDLTYSFHKNSGGSFNSLPDLLPDLSMDFFYSNRVKFHSGDDLSNWPLGVFGPLFVQTADGQEVVCTITSGQMDTSANELPPPLISGETITAKDISVSAGIMSATSKYSNQHAYAGVGAC
jgi:hypothetical protein